MSTPSVVVIPLSSKQIDELALRKAAESGDLSTVTQLISKGVNVNAKGADTQKTALHWAAQSGHKEICKVLLNAGAVLSLQDKNGNTALLLAKEDSIKKLLVTDVKVDEERKRGAEAQLDVACDPNQVRVGTRSLKIRVKATITSVKDFSSKYSDLMAPHTEAIKIELRKGMAGFSEDKIASEFIRIFSIDSMVKKYSSSIEDLERLVDVPHYMDTSVTALFLKYFKFKRNISDFLEQFEKHGDSLPKKIKKTAKRYIKKLVSIARDDFDGIEKTIKQAFIPLFENPDGFIEFIKSYFPGDLIDYTDSHEAFLNTYDGMDVKGKEEFFTALSSMKGLGFLRDLKNDPNAKKPENLKGIVARVLTLNSGDDIANAMDTLTAKSRLKIRAHKEKTLPCIERYFRDMEEKMVQLFLSNEVVFAQLKFSPEDSKRFTDKKDLIRAYVKMCITPIFTNAVAMFKHEKTDIVTYLVLFSYLIGFRLYSNLEKELAIVDDKINMRIQQVLAAENKRCAEVEQASKTLEEPSIEVVKLKEKQFEKGRVAAARAEAKAASERAGVQFLQQKLAEDKKAGEEKEKQAWVKKLFKELTKKDKVLTKISKVLNPKEKMETIMTKGEFFEIITKLKIPGYEGINTKKDSATGNKLTFHVGRFYSFTMHILHGIDKSDCTDPQNITHLRNLFESIGIMQSNFWHLVGDYAIQEKVASTSQPK